MSDTVVIDLLNAIMTTTTLASNQKSQTVLLPFKLRFPENVKQVEIRAHGVDQIVAPVGHVWDSFFIDGPQVTEDFMSERASQS